MKKSVLFVICLSTLIFVGCKKCEPPKTIIVDINLLDKNIIADTVIYEVIISNSDASMELLDRSQQYVRMDHFNKKAFIDSLFEGAYKGKYSVYDFFTDSVITPKKLAILEKEKFTRDDIGKIQFKEIWYYDTQNQVFRKKVISIILGAEFVDDMGARYKAVFKMNMN